MWFLQIFICSIEVLLTFQTRFHKGFIKVPLRFQLCFSFVSARFQYMKPRSFLKDSPRCHPGLNMTHSRCICKQSIYTIFKLKPGVRPMAIPPGGT